MGRAENYIPAFKFGHKVYPENIAGTIGLPSVGNVYYIDPNSGSDTKGGRNATDAFATVAQAISSVTAAQDDVVVFVGTNSTGRTAETGTVNFNKRRVHWIGNGPMRRINPRNGVGAASTLTGETTTALVTISANDQSFTNLSFATFQDNDIDVDITAPYNTFNNVHFQGIGVAAAGDAAGARAVRITGADENEFYNCTFGLDTVTRSTTNATLEQTGTCARNQYFNSNFNLFADNAGPVHIKADTGNCFERYLRFTNCILSAADIASSTTTTTAIDVSTTGNGFVQFIDSWWDGSTNLANNVTNVYNNMGAVSASDAGALIVDSNG